jgi:DUF4097 and DUF4098 domain-containing protein YvlB
MTVTKSLVVLGIAGLAGAIPLAASSHTGHSRNVSMRTDGPLADCSALHVTFDHRDAVVRTEERTITRAEAPVVRVKADRNGGVQVQGWEKEVYGVSLCKAAPAGAEAEKILSDLKLSFESGKITVTGATRDDVVSYLLIHAPRAAAIEVEVDNGPASVYHADGRITARATNGPVSAEGCAGEIDLSAQNGPVSSEDNSGKVRLHAQNGPVDVSLSGAGWTGSGLEAHADNGPVNLRIPHGYRSAVLVESDGNGPFQCSSICSEGRKTWDDRHKQIEFGSGPTLVHVSVNNGPLSVN